MRNSRTEKSPGKQYLIYDKFGVPLAAGAVNGTYADKGDEIILWPEENLRTLVDTNSKIFIANGVLNVATGGVGAVDGIWWLPIVRKFGVAVLCNFTPTTTGGRFGWATSASGAINDFIAFLGGNVLSVVPNSGAAIAVGAWANSTEYKLAAIMRLSGIHYFIKGGAFSNWTLLFSTIAGTAAGIPAIQLQSSTSVFTVDNLIAPFRLFIPVPLASDGFSLELITDGLGHAEANGGAGLTWLDAGTWTVAGGAVSNTPSVGAELFANPGFDSDTGWTKGTGWTISGGLGVATSVASDASIRQSSLLATGSWFIQSVDIPSFTAGGIYPSNGSTYSLPLAISTGTKLWTFRCLGTGLPAGFFTSGTTTLNIDNASLKLLALSTLFRSLVISTSDVYHRAKVVALTAGTQAGIVIRLDNATTPTQGIIVYFTGAGTIACEEFTGTTTYTALFVAVVKAFTASDSLIVHAMGTAIRMYHETAAGVATLIGTGTTSVVTGNLHGIFSTYNLNTLDDMITYPVGVEGQWEELSNM